MRERYIYASFSHKNSIEAQRIIEKIRDLGYNVVFDDGVVAGDDWQNQASQRIINSRCVIVFVTNEAMKSANLQREILLARSVGKEVIFVYLEEASLPSGMALRLGSTLKINASLGDDALLNRLEQIPSVVSCRKDSIQESVPQADSIAHVSQSAPPPPAQASVSASHSLNLPTEKKPRRRSVSQKVKSLFSTKKMTDVNFSVLTPAMFEVNKYTIVDIYAFEEDFRHVVEQAKKERARLFGGITETDGGHLQVRKGAKITVRLSSPDVEITDNEESREWTGKYVKFDFPVFLPEDYKKSQILFTAAVYFDSVIATRISFVAYCTHLEQQRPKIKQKDIHSAFISYASGDRERVALILQGMRRSRPDLDVFFDVETLKTGEDWENVLCKEIDRRDVLYLCWSKLAKESPWVEREWRYALEKKGLDGIEPIPLVLPKDCPPPEELQGKHFGAVELYYQ